MFFAKGHLLFNSNSMLRIIIQSKIKLYIFLDKIDSFLAKAVWRIFLPMDPIIMINRGSHIATLYTVLSTSITFCNRQCSWISIRVDEKASRRMHCPKTFSLPYSQKQNLALYEVLGIHKLLTCVGSSTKTKQNRTTPFSLFLGIFCILLMYSRIQHIKAPKQIAHWENGVINSNIIQVQIYVNKRQLVKY